MALPGAEHHIATLLDLCAARQAGLTTYTRGGRLMPAHMSYSELRALATQKADLLRRYEGIVPGKIVLIHFQSHLENIIWFWASILAGCIPALSTPIVNNSEGRIFHFKHLHHLLLDPIVITGQELVSSDFAENDILRVVAVEAVESLRRSKSKAAAQPQANSSANVRSNGHPNWLLNGRTDNLSTVLPMALPRASQKA